MKKQLQLFSPALWWQGIKKIRVPGIAMAIAVVAINALFPIISAANDLDYSSTYAVYDGPRMISSVDAFNEFAPMSILVLAFAPLLAFIMFSYLNDRSKSDFYHSIPQTRVCVFISLTAAVITWIVGVLFLTTALNLILWMTAKYHTVVVTDALYFMFCILIGALLCMSMAIFAMTLTGTTVSNLFVAALIFIVFRLLCLEVYEYLYDMVPVYDFTNSWTKILSFEKYLPVALFVAVLSGSYSHDMVGESAPEILIYSAVVTLLLLAFACFLYHIRRSEMAQKSAPNKGIQHIFRCAVTMPLLLYGVFDLAFKGLYVEQFWVFAISIVIYLLYELATTKKIKNMVRSIPMFFVLIAICAMFIGGMRIARGIIATDIPENTEVSTVAVRFFEGSGSYSSQKAEQIPISDNDAIDIVLEALEYSAPLTISEHIANVKELNTNIISSDIDEKEISYTTTSVAIRLNNGRTLYRRIWIENSRMEQLKNIYLSSEEYQSNYLSVPAWKEIREITLTNCSYVSTLTDAQEKEFWQVFSEEFNTLSAKEKQTLLSFSYSNSSHQIPGINVRGYLNHYSFYESYYFLPELLPRSTALLVEIRNTVNYGTDVQKLLTQIQTDIPNLDYETWYALFCQPSDDRPYTHIHFELVPCDSLHDTLITSYQFSFNSGNQQDFDDVQAAVKSLRITPEWFDYDATNRIMYYLSIDYTQVPAQMLSSTTPNQYFSSYIMLTAQEAETLIAALTDIQQSTGE